MINPVRVLWGVTGVAGWMAIVSGGVTVMCIPFGADQAGLAAAEIARASMVLALVFFFATMLVI